MVIIYFPGTFFSAVNKPLHVREFMLGNRDKKNHLEISYPESSGFLVSGAKPGKTLGTSNYSIFLIGWFVLNGS